MFVISYSLLCCLIQQVWLNVDFYKAGEELPVGINELSSFAYLLVDTRT